MIPYDPPLQAMYKPVPGKLSFAVTVLAERQMFGRKEYAIQAPSNPDLIWVTTGQDGQQLQFKEDAP